MAHTTFLLTAPHAMDAAQVSRWTDILTGLASTYDFKVDVSVVPPKRTVRIEQDRDAQDPRDWQENVGTMFCKHGRYTLGDKQADDPIVEVEGGEVDGIWMSNDAIAYAIEMLSEQLDQYQFSKERGDTSILEEFGVWTDAGIEAVTDELNAAYDSAVQHVVDDHIVLCLPIYLYDHSGLTVSHGSFSCQWDSGQVGWHYITKKAADDAWGAGMWTEETLRKCLEAELEEYDHYLRGNVWGFTVTDEEGDIVDSIWGFIGDDIDKCGILDAIDEESHDAAREAWNNRFD